MREKIQQILIQLRLQGMANILDKELNRAEKKGSAFDASRSLNVLKKCLTFIPLRGRIW